MIILNVSIYWTEQNRQDFPCVSLEITENKLILRHTNNPESIWKDEFDLDKIHKFTVKGNSVKI